MSEHFTKIADVTKDVSIFDFRHGDDDGGAFKTPTCIRCGRSEIVIMSVARAKRFASNGPDHIQDIFPNLSIEERELLKTGIHPECYEAMFAGQGEVEEDWVDAMTLVDRFVDALKNPLTHTEVPT